MGRSNHSNLHINSTISDWLFFNFILCSFSTQQATCVLMKTILRYEDKSRIELKYCWKTQWLNAKEIIMHETKIIFQQELFVLFWIHIVLPITQATDDSIGSLVISLFGHQTTFGDITPSPRTSWWLQIVLWDYDSWS